MRSAEAERKLRAVIDTPTPYEIVRGGIEIIVTENVYPTSELSELLVEVLDNPQLGIRGGEDVLDYGSGTGFLAINAALRGANVVAIDVSRDAIACGQLNAERHGVQDRISFRLGENLNRIENGETFDVILAGMPWDDADASTVLERSLFDPGFQMRLALFDAAPRILKVGGRIILSSRDGHEVDYPQAYPQAHFMYVTGGRRVIRGVGHTAVVVTIR
jgi:methylase of polypeptide subunit release factors